ncbi:Vms1/Ankzf1 family peptidyl-tRNA hydrolase [Arthrobacter zhaoxinii]|uniref:Vms1/Ankzf1 family peptidyl-tRNA hydrolase n=1 Tax=Arthrobacter zhaoxinii TaxID=2964616 RepID=A0ABY5YLC6_9MICC|nr:Vms1/Ankzf1 family peptidyl-tRNA hydrolase [Arthrobacter zhaoxinii]UWX95887.1 Vms1/Ankzf1 family peptidyl-tRNA hydrolase [Arthrobacter zhaoxinii]
MPGSRTTYVPAERLVGWLERFEASQGALEFLPDNDGIRVRAASGAEARLLGPWPADGRPGRGANDVERLASLAGQARTLGLVLARRGGYAVGVAREGRLLASKTGSSNSRRANAADALAGTVAEQAATLFGSAAPEYLVFGGDRMLAEQVAGRRELARWAGLPRLRPLDVPDPKAAVLEQAARDAVSVVIRITLP